MKPMKEEHLTVLRRHMVEVIAIHTDLASEELGKATLDERVRAAMRRMPRHLFVPASVALRASIGCSLCLPGHAAAPLCRRREWGFELTPSLQPVGTPAKIERLAAAKLAV